MADLLINRAVTMLAKTAFFVVFAAVSLAPAFSHDAIDVDANVFPWSSVGKIATCGNGARRRALRQIQVVVATPHEELR